MQTLSEAPQTGHFCQMTFRKFCELKWHFLWHLHRTPLVAASVLLYQVPDLPRERQIQHITHFLARSNSFLKTYNKTLLDFAHILMRTNVAKIYQFEFWPEIAPSPGKSHGTSHRRCSIKKYFLEIPQNSQENTCARVSFLIKLQALGLQVY